MLQQHRAAQCHLFAEWQVEKVRIGAAANGTVPKNSRGHVELLSPHHLPRGCVHVPDARAAMAARRLALDYAPALVGWACRGGRSLPLFRGVVVCAENADAVKMAVAARGRANAVPGCVLDKDAVAQRQHDEAGGCDDEEVQVEIAAGSRRRRRTNRTDDAPCGSLGPLEKWSGVASRLLRFLACASAAACDTELAAAREIVAILLRLQRALALTEEEDEEEAGLHHPPCARPKGEASGSWVRAARQSMMQACQPRSFLSSSTQLARLLATQSVCLPLPSPST